MPSSSEDDNEASWCVEENYGGGGGGDLIEILSDRTYDTFSHGSTPLVSDQSCKYSLYRIHFAFLFDQRTNVRHADRYGVEN
jgi:hypothetical protein